MKNGTQARHEEAMHYKHLAVMAGLSLISLYIFMYSMVDRVENALPNLNQFYMAGLMTTPMVLIELLVMRSMYQNKRWNRRIGLTSAVALIGFFALIRSQTAISDQQFLRSMIPHHAGAILMCKRTSADSPAIAALCQSIVSSQQAEIRQMNSLLRSSNQ